MVVTVLEVTGDLHPFPVMCIYLSGEQGLIVTEILKIPGSADAYLVMIKHQASHIINHEERGSAGRT